MTSKIRIFDHFARYLTEIEAPTTPRSWVLDDVGRCEFSMSTSDPKCTEINLQYGNLIHIEHLPALDVDGNSKGKLPDWVGIILPPRTWDFGVLHVVAYSIEALLSFRAMPFTNIQGTPKSMFIKLLGLAAEAANNIIIQPGVIEDVQVTFSDSLRLSAYEHIKKLAAKVGMDWDVTGEIDPKGNLLLYGNLYVHKGVGTELTLVNTNSEMAGALLTEQGNPSNQVFGYAQASTQQQRYLGYAENSASVGDYGALQINTTFMGLRDATSVRAAAQNFADKRGRPVRLFSRTVLDDGMAFSNLDTGNTVKLHEINAGFAPGGGLGMSAVARIKSISYNDLSNKCPLNLEVL